MGSFFRSKITLFFLCLIVIFLVLNLSGLDKTVKNFFYLFSSPIQKTLWQAGDSFSDFLAGFIEMQELKRENEELKLRIGELLAENTALKELEKENEVLRGSLGVGLGKDFQLQLARVVGKDSAQDSILIDRGSKDGVIEDLPVITSQKVLLGRIGRVFSDFSEVVLISNKESSFDAKLSGRDVFGVVKGKGSLTVSFELIPKEEEVTAGENVVTAALGGIFPPGILVGSLGKVRKTDIDPFQTAPILSSFDLGKLDYLFIITDF